MSASDNNPLYDILSLIPYGWEPVTMGLLEDIRDLLSKEGLHTKNIDNIYAVLIWMEEHKLVNLEEDPKHRTCKIKRVFYG